jgi:hypothetical protein
MAALLRSNMTMRVAERDHSRMIAEPAIKQCAASPPCLEADVKQHQIRRTWQVMCMSAALHACTTNRSPAPEHLSGTVIQGAGDTVDAGNAVSRAHADAGLGNAATGNGNTPPNMMMSAGTGGSPGITGSGGQPATTMTDGGAPSGGSGGSRGMMPPAAFDAGLSTPDDDDDDDAPDAATDAAVDTGVDDDDEHEGR